MIHIDQDVVPVEIQENVEYVEVPVILIQKEFIIVIWDVMIWLMNHVVHAVIQEIV